MSGNANMGHLVMRGIMKQEEHGYSKHVKSSATGVSRPNVQATRYWEKKLASAFNTVETVGKTVNVFEDRLLENLGLLEGPSLKKNGPNKARPPSEVLADAEKSVQRMALNLKRAKDSIRLAEKGAILPKDVDDVMLAKEALSDLDGIVGRIASRILELQRDFGLDSSL